MTGAAKLVVRRCVDMMPEGSPVPSRVIDCGNCGEDCWLSVRTEESVKARYSWPKVEVRCDVCLSAEARND